MSHPKKAPPFLDTRARSAVASTGPGLSVRFVPPALSAAGLAEMRFVRHLPGRRWVGRASRRASFQAVQRWLSGSGSTELAEVLAILTSPRSVNCCPFRGYAHHP